MTKKLSDSVDEGLEKKKLKENVSVVLDKFLGGEKQNLTELLTELGISDAVQKEMPIIEVKKDTPSEEVVTLTSKTSVANTLAEFDTSNNVVIKVEEIVEKVDQTIEKVEDYRKEFNELS